MDTFNFHLYIGSEAKVMFKDTPTHLIDCKYMTGFEQCGECVRVKLYLGTDDDELLLNEAKLVLRPLSSITAEEKSKAESAILTSPERYAYLLKSGFNIGLIPRDKYILTTEL